jgi:hypothetical protein
VHHNGSSSRLPCGGHCVAEIQHRMVQIVDISILENLGQKLCSSLGMDGVQDIALIWLMFSAHLYSTGGI